MADPIPLLDLQAQNQALMPQLLAAIEEVVHHGKFILGPEVSEFEARIAQHIGVDHAIGVSSGTDALLLALMTAGIGPGDEVITTPFTFFATGGCVSRVGARPVFVDIDADSFNLDPEQIEGVITPRTRAIIPVHLFGQPCRMKALIEIATHHNLLVIEDAAQALGATTPLGPVGALGDFGCFSFFPSKNLGGFGDGGLLTTADEALATRARTLRVHGGAPKYFHDLIGGNFRLDTIQAAVLGVKLPHLEAWTQARRENAARYDGGFAAEALPDAALCTPQRAAKGHVYNQYVIRTDRRDALADHLRGLGIDTAVYYPRCLHLQRCFASLGYQAGHFPVAEQAAKEVLALPMYPELSTENIDRVIRETSQFLRR